MLMQIGQLKQNLHRNIMVTHCLLYLRLLIAELNSIYSAFGLVCCNLLKYGRLRIAPKILALPLVALSERIQNVSRIRALASNQISAERNLVKRQPLKLRIGLKSNFVSFVVQSFSQPSASLRWFSMLNRYNSYKMELILSHRVTAI